MGVEPNLSADPAASGCTSDLKQSGPETRLRLLEIFSDCPWEMDVILVDVGAGIGNNVLSLHHPSFESLIVMTPEPTSFTDGYSLIKLLRRQVGIQRFSIAVNQVTDGRHGLSVFQKLKEVAGRFTDAELEYLGHCPRDEKIVMSVLKRKILIDLDQGAPSVACLELLAKRIIAKCQQNQTSRGIRFQEETARAAPGNTTKFWRTLLGEVRS